MPSYCHENFQTSSQVKFSFKVVNGAHFQQVYNRIHAWAHTKKPLFCIYIKLKTLYVFSALKERICDGKFDSIPKHPVNLVYLLWSLNNM